MRIAVVGTGISGNAAAWTLSKHYPVTVYDRELRPGGHSHTVSIDYDGTQLAVDIGFIVYNELNYPDLKALFAHLGVDTIESCMSFAVTRTPAASSGKAAATTGSRPRADCSRRPATCCRPPISGCCATSSLSTSRASRTADDRERAILGAIGYSPNTIYLHRDTSLMPKRRRAWASWNFLRWPRRESVANDVSVTYWMNELQGIDPDKPLFVSLNPLVAPDPALTFGKYLCEHPQYNAAAFAAQKRLPEIQGRRHTWFCGAWTGYGFHEDGLRSGLSVAEALGAVAPWRQAPPELAEAAE